MDEFEEFGIRAFRSYTEENDDMLKHDRNRCNFCEQSDATEIFPSPIDIYAVRRAWYGDQSCVSEDLDDGGQLCTSGGNTEAPRQGRGCCRTGPEDNAQRTPFATIARSSRTDSRECFWRSVSGADKVTGPCRTVVDGTSLAFSGETLSTERTSVGNVSTSLSLSSSSSSSSAAAQNGHSGTKVTDAPTVQLKQAVYRVRSFSTDNGRVLNLGDSFKVFNRLLLLLTPQSTNNNNARQPQVYQTPLCQSDTVDAHADESETSISATVKRSANWSATSRSAHKSANRNTRHKSSFSAESRDRDRFEFSDAETGDVIDERKELLERDDDRNSSEEEEDEECYELLRRIAFPAIPSPEDTKQRTSGASIALRSLGCEDDLGDFIPADESVPQEGDELSQWAGDSLLRVMLIGSQGVGKTTLTQQLMTSEYRPTDLVTSSDNRCCCPQDNAVVVQVDDVQSVIQFIDISSEVAVRSGSEATEVDVYLVVYSVTDRSSFKYAGAYLRQLSRRPPPPSSRSSATPQPVVILVANKQDLVRKRVVSENSGKRLALKRRCKFIEISAFLDHRVDELLVGILKQLQLQQLRQCAMEDGEEDEDDDDFRNSAEVGCLRSVSFLRFWRRLSWQYCSDAHQLSSCDDLFV